MIKRVHLENWRTHKDSDFEFGKGTNVLIGVMGSGKTSVMDGICFALFGTFPSVQARNLKLEEVITSNPNTRDFARVRLEFDYKGEEYAVERTVYRKGTNEGKLYRAGKLIAGPKTTEATARLEEILEMNYDLFSRAVYSEQNQLDYFLKLSAAQRKEKFDELLEISKYEGVRGNAVSVANRIKRLAEDQKGFLRDQQRRLDEGGLAEAKASLEKKEKLAAEGAEKLEAEKKHVGTLEKAVAGLAEKEKEFKALKEKALKARARAAELERGLKELERELKGVSPDKAGKRVQEIEAETRHSRAKIAEAEKKAEEKEAERTTLLELAAGNERETEKLRKAARELKEARARCPVCRAGLEEHAKHALLQEYEGEAAELEGKNKGLREHARKAEQEKEGLRREAREAQRKIEALAQEKNDWERQLKSAERLEKSKTEWTEWSAEAGKSERALKELAFDEERLGDERERLATAREKALSIEREIRGTQELAREIALRVKEFEERKKQVAELEASIKGQERVAEKLSVFTNALKATQAELRESLVNTVNEAMADIWEKIYPYGDYTSCRVEIVEGSYEIMVRERRGNWVRVEGILSGGERSAVAITLRVAISLVLAQNLSWLILDEPTHNLDARTVDRLSEMMRDHLPSLVDQVFIITHDKLMERAASASLYLLEREKETDGATRPVLSHAE